MENLEVPYWKLKIGGLYVYKSENPKKQFLMLYKNSHCILGGKDDELIGYVTHSTPFMILEKSSIDHDNSFLVMLTNDNTETSMGWIRSTDAICQNHIFFTGNEENTIEISNEEILNYKLRYKEEVKLWQMRFGGD